MATIRGDDRVLIVFCSTNANGDGLLTCVEVAKAANLLLLVQIAGDRLHAAYDLRFQRLKLVFYFLTFTLQLQLFKNGTMQLLDISLNTRLCSCF